MPRDGAGVYSLPPLTQAVPNTTILSSRYNTFIADVASDLNTPRPIGSGGTGATSASTARSNLGLVIGTDIQAFDADLSQIASISAADDDIIQRKMGAWTNRTMPQLKSDLAITVADVPGAAGSGANTDITSIYLNNTGLKIKDTNASHGLIIRPGSDITADRTLTITTGDANREVSLSGDLSIGGNLATANSLTTVGNFPISLTASASTSVTLPISGTLAKDNDSIISFNNTGLRLKDIDASNNLIISTASNLTSDRTLNINTGDSNRNIGLGGNLSFSNDLSTSGPFPISIAATAPTSVTLPTSGTLLNDSDKLIDLIGTFSGTAGIITLPFTGSVYSIIKLVGTIHQATSAATLNIQINVNSTNILTHTVPGFGPGTVGMITLEACIYLQTISKLLSSNGSGGNQEITLYSGAAFNANNVQLLWTTGTFGSVTNLRLYGIRK